MSPNPVREAEQKAAEKRRSIEAERTFQRLRVTIAAKGRAVRYLEWSTVVDAPITAGMTLAQLKKHIQVNYGNEGLRELPARLARVEAKGTSALDTELAGLLSFNRAGPNEKHLSPSKIWRRYCS